MRTLIPVWILVGIFLGLSIWSTYYLDHTASDFLEKTTQVEIMVDSEQWKKASEQMTKLNNQWAATRDWWAIIIDHHEIDNIEISLSRLSNLVKKQEVSDISVEIAELKKLLQHIPEKELLNIRNIL